jgi:hypothetical protein
MDDKMSQAVYGKTKCWMANRNLQIICIPHLGGLQELQINSSLAFGDPVLDSSGSNKGNVGRKAQQTCVA